MFRIVFPLKMNVQVISLDFQLFYIEIVKILLQGCKPNNLKYNVFLFLMTFFERSCIDNNSRYTCTQHLLDVLIVVDCRLSNICANLKMGVKKQYLKIYWLFCATTLQAYVETFALNNGISNIRVHWVTLDLCGIKVGCHFFGTPCS